jgi:hypothetical protein
MLKRVLGTCAGDLVLLDEEARVSRSESVVPLGTEGKESNEVRQPVDDIRDLLDQWLTEDTDEDLAAVRDALSRIERVSLRTPQFDE